MSSDYDDLQLYLARQNPRIRKHVSIVTPTDDGMDRLIHVSTNGNIRRFEPRVSQKTMNQEDRSLPRVSVSSFVLGAMAGYAVMAWDFNEVPSPRGFHGGWYLYQIPFTHALKPSTTIQPDVEGTGELYLVPYNDRQWRIIPTLVGKVYPAYYKTYWEYKKCIEEWLLYLEISDPSAQLTIQGTTVVTQGYWQLTARGLSADFHLIDKGEKYQQPTLMSCKPLSQADYTALKTPRADLLSYPVEVSSF